MCCDSTNQSPLRWQPQRKRGWGGREFLRLFFPSGFLFPLQPPSTDASRRPPSPCSFAEGAKQLVTDEGAQETEEGWEGDTGRQGCPLALLPAQPCLPAALKLFGSQIFRWGREENRRAESLLRRHLHLGKFQSSPPPATSARGVTGGLQERPHPFLPGWSGSASIRCRLRRVSIGRQEGFPSGKDALMKKK